MTPADDTGGPLAPRAPGGSSKARREFDRLTRRVAELKAQVADWRIAEATYQQRAAAEWQPLADKLRRQQREVALWIDHHLADPSPDEHLHRRLHDKLVAMLRLLAGEVLRDGADDEVRAAHDRHGAAFTAVRRSDDDVPPPVEPEADMPDESPAPRRPSREDRARSRNAQALQAASQSVREVWRRLASRLHPDRELDADERVRKTVLMAQVNDAYGRNDLFALLDLQAGLEQDEARRRADVPDERLRRFVRMLDEQRRSLERELADVQAPVARHYGGAVGANAQAGPLMSRVMDDHLAALREATASLRSQLAALRDPRSRAEYLAWVQLDGDASDTGPEEPAPRPRRKGRRG